MKLTIGMAVAEDYDGVYFSVQALRMYHPEVIRDVELILVDNQPRSKSSPMLKNLMEDWVKHTAGSRYIAMDEKHGTTQPRNRIFEEATGDAVLCMDSHVLLKPGVLRRLFYYYEQHPDSKDLISGPMLYDDLVSCNTHFDNIWRAEMWGIWGTAWSCPKCNSRYTVLQDPKGQADFRVLSMALESYISDSPKCHCGNPLPSGPFAGHQQRMKSAGFINLGESEGEPFPVPGQGLGLFTCRKDAWLGFNPYFRGFGGEEMYIHEKYRKAGHQALCASWLKWGHRFGRPHGIPYAKILTRWNKIRNYVLGAQEVGYTLDPIHEHFVGQNLMQQWEWDSLISDAINLEAGPKPPRGSSVLSSPKKPPAGCGSENQPRATINSVGELLAWVKENPRDLDQHVDKIAEYASKSKVAVELSKRKESIIPLLKAEKVYSFNAEMSVLLTRVVDLFPDKVNLEHVLDIRGPLPDIPECDLLFLSYIHDAPRLMAAFDKYGPIINKYIILHNTHYFGEINNENGSQKPGLLPGLRVIMRGHPEWSIIYHDINQYGLTVLSKVPEEKQILPSVITMAANLAKATAAYVTDGLKNSTKEEFEHRLEICSICLQRTDERCSVCGCFLHNKAKMRSSECPLGKWPQLADAVPQETN